VDREHPVLVTSEGGELVHVLPDALVRRVKQVRPVAVYLDPGFRFCLGVGVAAEVVAPFQHQHPLVQLGGGTFGHGETEKAGPDDDEVIPREAHVAGG
jgi:hypothetical protein